jgi:uncharacterized membrane protein
MDDPIGGAGVARGADDALLDAATPTTTPPSFADPASFSSSITTITTNGLALRAALGILLGIVLAARGYRRRSLTLSGAAAAAAVGAAHVACGFLPFAAVLLVFFYGSSAATRAGVKRKAQLEEGFHTARGARQVLSNGAGGALAAAVASAAGSGLDVCAALLPPLGLGWLCVPPARLAELARAAFVAHYACCMGDTLASEIGVLSAYAPRLITRLRRRVPPGTNGGVTALGMAAAAAGGLVVGLAFAFASTIAAEVVAVSAAGGGGGGKGGFGGARGGGGAAATTTPRGNAAAALAAAALVGDGAALAAAGFGATAATASALLGAGAGLAGATLDSVLGATLQYSGVRLATGRAVSRPGPGVRHTCGRDLLGNDSVNALSALAAGVAAAFVTAAGF